MCSNTFIFYYTAGVFKHKENIQKDKIESFFSIQMSQMNCFCWELKLETQAFFGIPWNANEGIEFCCVANGFCCNGADVCVIDGN